jgi:hypothetical protein
MVGWYMDEMERIWKKKIVELQSLHSPGEAEETYGNP